MYPNEDGQLCYIWHKYEGKEDSVKLLTNSLNLSLPFNEKSPEFVATVNSDYTKADNYSDEVDLTNNIDENGMPTNYTIYKNNYSSTIKTHWNSKTEEFDIPIPEEYQGLRILRKTL